MLTHTTFAGAVVGLLIVGGSVGRSEPSTGPEDSSAPARLLRERGLHLGYNLDHDAAIAAFQEAATADPANSAAPRLAAATAWIQLLFEQGAITVDDYLGEARAELERPAPMHRLATAFHASIQQALTLSEERLRATPQSADAHYQVGAAYGCLASYTATVEGRLVGSLGAARRAYREHERVLALDPTRKDAGLVVGIYDYVVASLPAPLRLMARIAGFGSNRERALRLVEEAAAYSSDAQPNARFVLVLLYNREHRFADARQVIERLQRDFPRNRLLWLEAASTALRAGDYAEAKAASQEGLARLTTDPRPRATGEEARWRYTHGAALVGVKQEAAAREELNAALRLATRNFVRGRAHQELGKLADLSGSRQQAIAEYREAARLCRQDHDDECANAARSLEKKGYR